MMGDRNFAAHAVAEWLEPLGVILFSIIALVVLGGAAVMYHSHQVDLEIQSYQKQCSDAGGVPVIPYPHIKGEYNGHLCINPSAIIQLKD